MLPKPLDPLSILPWEKTFKLDVAEADLPGVSIVIPIYNAGGFLEKTLRSLICNDLSGVDLILMDANSTDNTREIVEHYRDIFAITVFEKDEGQSDAINKGYAQAEQPILYWLNGDDLILPNALVAVRRAFRDNPGSEVVVGNAYMTEKDLTPIRHFVFSEEKLTFKYLLDYAAHHLVQPSVFFSRTAWDTVGPLKVEQHYAMDADLFLGMAAKFKFRYIPVDIGYSVYHEECKTRGKRAESITELALVQASHGGFTESRKTLDILVNMFNEAEKQIESATPPTAVEVTGLKLKLKMLQDQVEKNKLLLLREDMELI